MRIAFVTETWLPSTDGVVTRLAATVRELCRDGHQVLIVAPAGGEPEFGGATVRSVPARGLRRVYAGKRWGLPLPRIGRYLREFAPDVVHVVNPMVMGIPAVLTARRRGWPLIASYHTDVARYAGYYRLGWLSPVIWWLLRRLHGQAAINLATSSATCAELREHGIDRVRLWRRGVDLELFRPRPAGHAPGGTPVAVYVGRLAAEKGLDRLASLAEDGSVRLLLVGDGPAREDLAARFHASSVTFTGLLHGTALASAYAAADVFVFPSTTDTLGLVLLEALASGLPVIAADSPASREILRACPVGRLFPADQAHRLPHLVRETWQQAPAEHLAALARREAEQWSWSAATAELLDRYREVLGVARPAVASEPAIELSQS